MDFIWRSLHGAHHIGPFWKKIRSYEHRAACLACGEDESLAHILFECRTSEQKHAWRLAARVWRRQSLPWPRITLGTVLGCGLATITDSSGKPKEGASRLLRIFVSETAFLIWKLRNTRVIEHRDDPSFRHTKEAVQNRWLHTINTRLTLDRAMTNSRFEKKALPEDTVLRTWSGVLSNKGSLPDNWMRSPGVLVGMGATATLPREEG
ncbi:hypothetical protein BV25DRAFT_1833638 [Artomyces pyxidatus]|uniref:Uncharacterized protein n=1 Tax=Artomyces pyxidatus TaxID=48021 RepID=A0ACB8SDV9_9AGAM|nr:hypothetical protein BV25DRAFT_1833638 [Artomyces pyxidatus]